MKIDHKPVRLTTCLLILLAAIWTVPAEPVLNAPSIRYSNSQRVTANGWATFSFELINPDNRPVDLQVTVSPTGQRNKTIYDFQFNLPPRSSLSTSAPLTVGTVKQHEATLFADGNVISTQEMLIEVASSNDRFLVFLNDDADLSRGSFSKNDALRSRYLSGNTGAEQMPEHFAGYGEAHMLIAYRPDFDRLNTRQVQALRDFVARGGTLLFADPHGLMNAWEHTRLQELIPVTPLQIRPLLTLTATKPIGGQQQAWEDGIDFLDSAPRRGISTLSQDGYPVVHWGRYGLGLVGVTAINFSDRSVQATPNFSIVWNHLLDFGNRTVLASSTGDQDLSRALDHITGIEIPSATHIRLFLVGYFLLVALFILGGIALRKRIHAWVTLSLLAIATTVLIFAYANQRARELSVFSASVLSFHSLGTDDPTGEQLVSLFLKREETLSLATQSTDQQLRALQPPPKRFLQEEDDLLSWKPPAAPSDEDNPNIDRGTNETIREPLRISRRDGIDHLANMVIPYQSPRFYVTLFPTPQVPIQTAPPVIRWQLNGFELAPWTPPADLDITHAMLVMERDVLPLNLRDGQVVTSSGPLVDILAESEEVVFIQQYLSRRNMPGPILALMGAAQSDPTGILPDQFDILGRHIYLFPVIEDRTSETAAIPYGRIDIRAESATARILWREGRWQPEASMKGEMTKTFTFAAYLPPAYGQLDPERLRILFEADNRGRNIEFAIKLVDRQGNTIDPIEQGQAGNVFSFDELPDNLIDPVDGRFEIQLQARTLGAITDFTSALRMNTWIIREFDAAVEGALPPETRGKL